MPRVFWGGGSFYPVWCSLRLQGLWFGLNLLRLLSQNTINWVAYKLHIFIPVLEVGKAKIKTLAKSMSGRDPLPGSQPSRLSAVYSCGGKSKWALWSFIKRVIIRFMRDPFSRFNHLPKAQPPSRITLRIKFQHLILGVTQFLNSLIKKIVIIASNLFPLFFSDITTKVGFCSHLIVLGYFISFVAVSTENSSSRDTFLSYVLLISSSK